MDTDFFKAIYVALGIDEEGIKARFSRMLSDYTRFFEEYDPARVTAGFALRSRNNSGGGVQVEVGIYYFPKNENLRKICADRESYLGPHLDSEYDNSEFNEQRSALRITLMTFTIQPYPVCCGLKMFHTFSHSQNVPLDAQDEFNDVLLEVLQYIHRNIQSLYSSRIEAVFVSNQSVSRPAARTKEEPAFNDGASFHYPAFRRFFYQKAAKIQAHPFYNYNSGNLLEKCEALFSAKTFPQRH